MFRTNHAMISTNEEPTEQRVTLFAAPTVDKQRVMIMTGDVIITLTREDFTDLALIVGLDDSHVIQPRKVGA